MTHSDTTVLYKYVLKISSKTKFLS